MVVISAPGGSHQGQLNIDRLLGLMDDYPHLVADISTLTQGNRVRHLPKVLRDPRLRDRLLFGTDHPLTNTPLVHPLLYPLRLRFSQIVDLLRTGNPWDRSVKLKAALGVPPEVFTKSRDYLRIPPFQEPLRGDPASGAS